MGRLYSDFLDFTLHSALCDVIKPQLARNVFKLAQVQKCDKHSTIYIVLWS